MRASTAILQKQDLQTVAIDGATYGPLKVLCQDTVMKHYPRHLVIRPSYVIGPDDYTQRFSSWVNRLTAGGVVDAPGSPEVPIQYIDVRDLSAFAVSALETRLQGLAPAGTQLRWPWMPVPLSPMAWSLARWHTLRVMCCRRLPKYDPEGRL